MSKLLKPPDLFRPNTGIWLLPGGRSTGFKIVYHLAWLSGDPRVRAVAQAWRALDARGQIESRLGCLCRAAGTTETEFQRAVIATGYDLHALNSSLPLYQPERYQSGEYKPSALELRISHRSVKSAFRHALMRGEPVEAHLDARRYRRLSAQRMSLWDRNACDYVVNLRRRLRLSQAQVADLFMVDERSVKRWEARRATPTLRHRWFLCLFQIFVKEQGVRAFRRRFVGEKTLYGKRGRPPRDGAQTRHELYALHDRPDRPNLRTYMLRGCAPAGGALATASAPGDAPKGAQPGK